MSELIFIFKVTRHEYYAVKAKSAMKAMAILQDCDDLAEYGVTHKYQTLNDIKADFELIDRIEVE